MCHGNISLFAHLSALYSVENPLKHHPMHKALSSCGSLVESKVANFIKLWCLDQTTFVFYPLYVEITFFIVFAMISLSFSFVRCGEYCENSKTPRKHHPMDKDLSSCGGLVKSKVAHFFEFRSLHYLCPLCDDITYLIGFLMIS